MCCGIPNEFLLPERLLPSDNLSNEFSFLLSIRNAICPEYFVKPNGGLAVRIGMLPGVPWKIGLRFSSYQAPINGGNVIFLRDGQ
jgi:hypothetical protein